MKWFSAAIFFSLIATNLFANDSDLFLEKCLKKVSRHYHQFGPPSDNRKSISKVKILKANEILTGFQNQSLASFDTDVLVYMGSGSYYSGYFQDYIVADPSDCQVLEIINIYSE